MNKVFLGKNTVLSEYFSDVNYIELDLYDNTTWSSVDSADALFFYIPKREKTLETTKRFFLYCASKNVKHVVKLGSLGPFRVIHKQLDAFATECELGVTTINIAPLMNALFYEQYRNNILYNYRFKTPAPYLDPAVLVSVIESVLGNPFYFGKELDLTGDRQYYIKEVADLFNFYGFPVKEIRDIPYNKTHDIDDRDPDEILLSKLGRNYYLGWYPQVNLDTLKHFNLRHRTLPDFILQDRHIFKKSFSEDKWL